MDATWIAAWQVGVTPPEAFIQVGTYAKVMFELGNTVATYYAVWTDSAHGLHPIPLLTVQPYDRVFASLVLGQLAPYPHLSAIRFDHLMVNGKPLGPCCVNPLWMSRGRVVLAPSALKNGSFALRPQRPQLSGAQVRWLDKSGAEVSGSTPTGRAEAELSIATADSSAFHRAAKRFARGLREQIAAIRAVHWPEPVHRSIEHYLGALSTWAIATNASEAIPTTGLQAWRTAWYRAGTRFFHATLAADRAFGVPELGG